SKKTSAAPNPSTKALSSVVFLVEKQTYRKRPSHLRIQRLNDEPPPTKTTQEPNYAHHIIEHMSSPSGHETRRRYPN
ncbi:hypothetical protein, partial [Bifidobacterium pullorum]|uniref:hypothetical protein n=1 Tax=Bifidobacterium pullorum TaxID=78448 RepID=UPI0019D40CAF